MEQSTDEQTTGDARCAAHIIHRCSLARRCSLMVIHHILRAKRHRSARRHRRLRGQTNKRPTTQRLASLSATELKLWLEYDHHISDTDSRHTMLSLAGHQPCHSIEYFEERFHCFFQRTAVFHRNTRVRVRCV